jgi:hypothetical protein
VAPGRSTSHASRIVSGEPTASNAWSTPPGASASTAAAGSTAPFAATAWVAPRARAIASFDSSRSTATISPAPASRAAATSCSPIPPQPTMQTASPTDTPAALRTAPTAVTTPQLRSAASHSGSSAGIGTADPAGTTQRSAKQETKMKCCTGRPSGKRRRDVPSSSVPARPWSAATSHRLRRPALHARHSPHAGTKQNATGSPTATWVTPSPTASTSPAPSWPGTIGWRPSPRCPSARCRSERQTPAAATRTSTSPAPGGASSSSQTWSGVR